MVNIQYNKLLLFLYQYQHNNYIKYNHLRYKQKYKQVYISMIKLLYNINILGYQRNYMGEMTEMTEMEIWILVSGDSFVLYRMVVIQINYNMSN